MEMDISLVPSSTDVIFSRGGIGYPCNNDVESLDVEIEVGE